MNTKIYVGNLPFESTEDEITEYFSTQGTVKEVNLIIDRETGRAKGFAFVTMGEASEMEDAIRNLDGQDFNGRPLKVNEAKPRENNNGGGNYRRNNDNRDRRY